MGVRMNEYKYYIFDNKEYYEIWNGENANTTLKAVSENIMTQITGESYVEEALPDPNDEAIISGLTED